MKRSKLIKYVNWDVDTWSVGFKYIIERLRISDLKDPKVLEIGCSRGGVSVGIVNELGFDVVCSDVDFPEERVLTLHPEMQGNKHLEFDAVNGLKIKYPDSSFDIVIFKSVLGYVFEPEDQQTFINEIYRVLKRNGLFCFMENCKASGLHAYARGKFASWRKEWRYVSLDEMKHYLEKFKSLDIHTNGFFAAFVTGAAMKRLAYIFDRTFGFLIPERNKYVMYGIATK